MKPTEQTKMHLIRQYVQPARQRGETSFEVQVGTVQKELGWTNRTPSVFSTMISKDFQDEAGVRLVEKKGGPTSGGPSTSWRFVYRVLDSESDALASDGERRPAGLLALYGVCAEMYREVGGAEAFIRGQREDFGSIVRDDAEDGNGGGQ